MKTKVLIVEDDAGVARFLDRACQEAGYTPRVVGDGLLALNIGKEEHFDLILLDVMLPSMSGYEVCRELREAKVNSSILIVTARDTLNDKIAGLDAGADDYVCKPFRVPEILARMRALLRRREPSKTQLQVGDLTLDTTMRHAVRGGQLIRLSQTEFSLLEYMMRNADRPLPRNVILEHVWEEDFDGSDNVLDVYIGYLRNKIDKNRPPLIHTVRGVGYRMGTQ